MEAGTAGGNPDQDAIACTTGGTPDQEAIAHTTGGTPDWRGFFEIRTARGTMEQ